MLSISLILRFDQLALFFFWFFLFLRFFIFSGLWLRISFSLLSNINISGLITIFHDEVAIFLHITCLFIKAFLVSFWLVVVWLFLFICHLSPFLATLSKSFFSLNFCKSLCILSNEEVISRFHSRWLNFLFLLLLITFFLLLLSLFLFLLFFYAVFVNWIGWFRSVLKCKITLLLSLFKMFQLNFFLFLSKFIVLSLVFFWN